MLGYVPDDVTAAPAAAAGRLSQRLGVPMGELRKYGEREQTRTEHLRQVAAYAGWRSMGTAQWKELDELLTLHAVAADAQRGPAQEFRNPLLAFGGPLPVLGRSK